jgi:hypothetical protein
MDVEIPAATRAVLLVEGQSDKVAVETVARRRGRDLAAERVEVVAMGGVTNIGHHLAALVGRGIRLGGLYDAREQHVVRRALERVGLRHEGSPASLGSAGFFVCVEDLEDEFIRVLGVERTLAMVEAAGELDAFRLLQRQPAQRDRPLEAQLRRFAGTKGGRKARYGRLFAEAVDARAVPPPIEELLAWA